MIKTYTITFDANSGSFGSSTYTVSAVSGASYGFALNSSGYYESQNKAISSSAALIVLAEVHQVNVFVRNVAMRRIIPVDYVIIAQMKGTMEHVMVAELVLIIQGIQTGAQLLDMMDIGVCVNIAVRIVDDRMI